MKGKWCECRIGYYENADKLLDLEAVNGKIRNVNVVKWLFIVIAVTAIAGGIYVFWKKKREDEDFEE